MAEVKVLIQGYAKEIGGGWVASSTTALIKDGGANIIFDPGINRKLLLKKLAEEGLTPEDINWVFMSHYHPDHNYLSGIFTKARALDDGLIYDEDKEIEHEGKIPGTSIKIINTPGHEKFHASLVVETEEGVVVLAGDVFWWADGDEQDVSSVKALLEHPDPYVKDEEALRKSREEVLKVADWIIPGHGKMFKNPSK